MKTPRDLADTLSRKKTGIIRETLRIPQAAARRRAKQLFEEFPSATYLTEIEAWRTSPGGTVELTVKRLEAPIDEAD
jgi:hypothetical protein